MHELVSLRYDCDTVTLSLLLGWQRDSSAWGDLLLACAGYSGSVCVGADGCSVPLTVLFLWVYCQLFSLYCEDHHHLRLSYTTFKVHLSTSQSASLWSGQTKEYHLDLNSSPLWTVWCLSTLHKFFMMSNNSYEQLELCYTVRPPLIFTAAGTG
jgi:hypothetical protein